MLPFMDLQRFVGGQVQDCWFTWAVDVDIMILDKAIKGSHEAGTTTGKIEARSVVS